MPSSLIFAALAAAWFAVLVPMIAKRRQEVARIAESALASRVLPRQHTHHAAPEDGQEVPPMSDRSTGLPPDERHHERPDERRYRPGRGGYDPRAAALAARARYLARQRTILGLLIGVAATLVLALVVSSWFWWPHVALVLMLATCLTYLRRQVRIEEAVRAHRAARMAGSRPRAAQRPVPEVRVRYDELRRTASRYERSRHDQTQYDQGQYDQPRYDSSRPDGARYEESREMRDPEGSPPPVRRAAPPPHVHPTAVALDLDDEDPLFDELDPAFEPPYRRAVGE